MNVILLHSDQRRVSAASVAIYRAVKTSVQIQL